MKPPGGQPQPRAVLDYLRDMIDLCRSLHRHDLLREYTEAWELAAETIYGALPPRALVRATYVHAPAPSGPPPRWREEMLARPLRLIVRRFRDDEGFPCEALECGHVVFAGVQLPESSPARRRRCAECARETAARLGDRRSEVTGRDPRIVPSPVHPEASQTKEAALQTNLMRRGVAGTSARRRIFKTA